MPEKLKTWISKTAKLNPFAAKFCFTAHSCTILFYGQAWHCRNYFLLTLTAPFLINIGQRIFHFEDQSEHGHLIHVKNLFFAFKRHLKLKIKRGTVL